MQPFLCAGEQRHQRRRQANRSFIPLTLICDLDAIHVRGTLNSPFPTEIGLGSMHTMVFWCQSFPRHKGDLQDVKSTRSPSPLRLIEQIEVLGVVYGDDSRRTLLMVCLSPLALPTLMSRSLGLGLFTCAWNDCVVVARTEKDPSHSSGGTFLRRLEQGDYGRMRYCS